MKPVNFIFVFTLLGLCSMAFLSGCKPRAESLEVQLREANTHLINDRYQAAIKAYQAILEERESAELHHNLGIAHYLKGSIGAAVLHLEKALVLDATAAPTKEILSLIRRSESVPAPSLSLLERMANSLSEEFWMVLLVIGLWGFLGFGVLMYGLVDRRSVYRDLSIGCLFVFILAMLACFGISDEGKRGILMSENNDLRIVPTQNGEIFMNFDAGEPVIVLQISGDFVFVETEKSVRGWIESEKRLLDRLRF